MRIELHKLTKLPAIHAQNFDLHEEYGFACCIENEANMTVFLNGVSYRSWAIGEHPHIYMVRWFNRDEVICGYIDSTTMLVSSKRIRKLHTSNPYLLFVSDNYIFVGYSEEDMYSFKPLDFVSDGLAAFTHEGDYVGGAQKFLTKAIQPSIDEVSAGYIFNDSIIFIAYCEEMIFRFDPARMELNYFPVTLPEPFSIVNSSVFVGDSKQACAILDSKPPFEFAVFDLEKEVAYIRDFTEIEKVLIEAGFAMEKIWFRPNSVGRIIATDRRQAALLEISDFL
jgi:hypothetical protein